MTNNKDFSGIPPAQAYNPATKTYQVVYLEQQPEQTQPSEKDQKVAESYATELDAYEGIGVQKGYGPCSYYGCNHKNKSFNIDISIEGCKWWGRTPGEGCSLPGYWEQSPTGSYRWRENLWLNHMGHGQDADSLIGRNHLYTVNTVGLYAMEDNEFCAGAQNFIRECIRIHEQGYDINEPRTLPSETTRATKWTVKITAGAIATATLGPGGAILAGGATWAVNKGVQTSIQNEKAKHTWNMIGNAGGDVAKGVTFSTLGAAAGEVIGGIQTGSSVGAKLFKEFAENTEKHIGYGISTFEFSYHLAHLKEGRNYDSSCDICN